MGNLTRRVPAACVVGFCLSMMLGCSGKSEGTISGTVTYKGAPVETGTVNFLSKTGAAAMGDLGPSGAFKIADPIAAGEYTVYVSPPVPTPQPPGTKPAPPKKFDVPPKFRDPKSSGYVVTIKTGSNTVPVDLKD